MCAASAGPGGLNAARNESATVVATPPCPLLPLLLHLLCLLLLCLLLRLLVLLCVVCLVLQLVVPLRDLALLRWLLLLLVGRTRLRPCMCVDGSGLYAGTSQRCMHGRVSFVCRDGSGLCAGTSQGCKLQWNSSTTLTGVLLYQHNLDA